MPYAPDSGLSADGFQPDSPFHNEISEDSSPCPQPYAPNSDAAYACSAATSAETVPPPGMEGAGGGLWVGWGWGVWWGGGLVGGGGGGWWGVWGVGGGALVPTRPPCA